MIGQTLWTEFFANRDWPVASAVAVVLVVLLVAPIAIYQHLQARGVEGRYHAPPVATNLTALGLGLAFLYAPIVILVIYSFNASRLVTVWGGWSTSWYVALLDDREMIDAAFASLGIALASSALATVLGTMAALALARSSGFAAASRSPR